MRYLLKFLNIGNFGLLLVLICPFIFLFFYIATEQANYDLGRTSTDAIWNISRALLDLNKLSDDWSQPPQNRDIKKMVEQQQIILSYLNNIQEIDRKYQHYENFVATEISAAITIISGWETETFQSGFQNQEIKLAQRKLGAFYLQTGTTIFSSDWIYRNVIMLGSFIIFLISFFILVKYIRRNEYTLAELKKSQTMLLESKQSAVNALSKLEKSRGLLIETRQTALTKIASNVFHEFSNCLWLTALLAEEALTLNTAKEKNDSIHKIQTHLQKTRDMLANLRVYIRGEKLTTATIDLGHSISDLTPLLETISGPEIDLEVSVTPNCIINIVPDQVRQIVTNLVKNAVEAMPSGGRLKISVELLAKRSTRDEQWIILRVSDSGIGMSEDVLNNVFTPFFSINKESGTGMGLTGVESWVTGAKGHIKIKSIVGEGSVFSVYLPTALPSTRQPPSEEKETKISHALPTILLIDDEEYTLELQAASLRRQNFHVFTASDPAQIEPEKIKRADLLISDIRMPHKDGVSVVMDIQKIKSLPVIFLTGDELLPEVEKALEKRFPFAPIAFKPISTRHLIEIISSITEHSSPRIKSS